MDLYNSLLPIRVLSPLAAAITNDTPQVGEIIDMQGFERFLYVIATGTLADAGATFTVLIEESGDSGLSGAAAVADADLNPTEAIVSFDEADDNDTRRIEYTGSKRYHRMTITPAGNGDVAPMAVVGLYGRARHLPVTAQAT